VSEQAERSGDVRILPVEDECEILCSRLSWQVQRMLGQAVELGS
jgi:hypothetical protein